MEVVLKALGAVLGSSPALESISPREIVMLNEQHIAMLIGVFVSLAQQISAAQKQSKAAITDAPGAPSNGNGAGGDRNADGSFGYPSQQQRDPGAQVGPSFGDGEGPAPPLFDDSQDYRVETMIPMHGGIPSRYPPPHPITSAEDDAEEIQYLLQENELSEQDSAEATQNMVEAWKDGVVHPADENAQLNHIRQSMKGVHELLSTYDAKQKQLREANAGGVSPSGAHYQPSAAAVGQPPRVYGHIPVSRKKRGEGKEAEAYATLNPHFSILAAMPKTASERSSTRTAIRREDKIAQLRQKRLLETADLELASAYARQHSLAEASMADFGRQVMKQRRRDMADLKKFVRDEDTVYREAFLKVIAARKKKLETKAELAHDELYYDTTNVQAIRRAQRNRDPNLSFGMEGHISDSAPTDIVLAAKKALARYAITHRTELTNEYNRYRQSMSRWRDLIQ